VSAENHSPTVRGWTDDLVPAFALGLLALVAVALYALADALRGAESWTTPTAWMWSLMPFVAAFVIGLFLAKSNVSALSGHHPATLFAGYVVAALAAAAAVHVSGQNAERRISRDALNEAVKRLESQKKATAEALARQRETVQGLEKKQKDTEEALNAAREEAKTATGDAKKAADAKVKALSDDLENQKKETKDAKDELDRLAQEAKANKAALDALKKKQEEEKETKDDGKKDDTTAKDKDKDDKDQGKDKGKGKGEGDEEGSGDDKAGKLIAAGIAALTVMFPQLAPLLSLLPAFLNMGVEERDMPAIANAAQAVIRQGSGIDPDKFVRDFLQNNKLKNPKAAKEALKAILNDPFMGDKIDEATKKKILEALDREKEPQSEEKPEEDPPTDGTKPGTKKRKVG
jgi:hypothetical protein